ncbi:MAG: carotenoid biosynthesis protein [bacterium]
MEGKKNKLENYSRLLLYVMFLVGIVGHLFPPTRSLMMYLTPFTLLLFGAIVLYPDLKDGNTKLLLWLAATYCVTFLIEVIGVKTGLIFGHYIYGNVLGLKVFDVPLIIGLNWVVVIYGAFIIASKMSRNIFVNSIITGILAVVFDFVLEPAAVKIGYWQWEQGIIPLQNYIAWFIIAMAFITVLNLLKYNPRSMLPVHYYNVQLIFFVVLSINF